MYLINIETLELIEFVGKEIPPYAILSHRWGSEELTFKEVSKRRMNRRKEGYRKLVDACRIAATYRVRFMWIDTCCIDKKSSAELSEAINSMFSWYKNANVCLAYLRDVDGSMDPDEAFASSIWFTRAWTLQELLAPKDVVFFDYRWQLIGNKKSRAETIELITGIPIDALKSNDDFGEWSICERMGWASGRHATRSEDVAYSLMGIFGIHMPLLYGEGTKAFIRLQEEIIRHATDPTFLLWGFDNTTPELLAGTPADFQQAQQLGVMSRMVNTPFSLTNIGLQIEITLIRYQLGIYGLVLGSTGPTTIVLLVQKYPWLDAFYRIGVKEVSFQDLQWSQERKLTVLRGNTEQNLTDDIAADEYLRNIGNGFIIKTNPSIPMSPSSLQGNSRDIHDLARSLETKARLDGHQHTFKHEFTGPAPGTARFECTITNSKALWIDLTFDFDSRPCLTIRGQAEGIKSFNDIQNPALWQISQAFEGPMTVRRHFGLGEKEVKLRKICDEESDFVSYFLRCSEREVSVSAKVPVELTSSEQDVWLSFIKPWCKRNEDRFWLLEISSTRPTDIL